MITLSSPVMSRTRLYTVPRPPATPSDGLEDPTSLAVANAMPPATGPPSSERLQRLSPQPSATHSAGRSATKKTRRLVLETEQPWVCWLVVSSL
ncbi:hypothetical protein B0T14DRAFT_186641 [Immersiella caudata]|uniref:Uncharacterized protein n=1 Tax=Immersiella caudata TaxID=314043 RepID=A0AA40C359_9PEZI|nr:hypothetical protein B0T14DRAFT_186641 [Immersiella caudata]